MYRPKIALMALVLAMSAFEARADLVVNFDNVKAGSNFNGVKPGGDVGPTFTFSGATFKGGVVLNDTNFGSMATSSPNIYATSDVHQLADGSSLPGVITGSLSFATTGISLDVLNGYYAGKFTLTAYAANNTILGTRTVSLGNYGTSSALGHLSLTTSKAIDHFSITSNQADCQKVFAIDSVKFTTAVPEPSSVVLSCVAGLGLFASRKRLRREA